ncbi:MAG TPA: FHA domain-containing protein, partial [Steroidobacteraceae bacterium]|nr:FHA domain-containing protein [Steroidobacteraceae bacterium]
LREHQAQAQMREQELSSALSAQQQRNTELETARRELESDAAALRTQAEIEFTAARARIEALSSETRQQVETLSALRAQMQAQEEELQAALSAQQQRNAELETARRELEAAGAAARAQAEAEAAAARVRIAALEADGQKQAESVRDLKVQLGAVRDSLAQRNALIERVEAEAASSVAMLGNIQHNLEHLGAEDQPHLLTRTDGATGIVHLLGRRTTIGRTPDNDVHIDAEFISRHHAVALRAGTKTVIEDLNSTNGTYVNGQRVSRRTLKDGDLVALGTTEFRFSIKAPA